jgi:hypothetical protein
MQKELQKQYHTWNWDTPDIKLREVTLTLCKLRKLR